MSNSLSLKDLLQPISKDDPSGPSLRYENIYDDIREAMRSEDSNLPQGVWQRKLKQPDWKKAEKLCFDTLANKSKDLQIAAWLIECLIHNKETSDITQGFQAFHDLMVKFWDTIHPQIPEDGDIDFRLSPFIWINEKLSMHLNEIKINTKTEVGATIYTFNTWIELTRNHDLYQVEDRPEKPDVIDQLGSNDNPTILDLQTNIEKTPTEFYQNLKELCQTIIDICQSIEEFLDQKFKDESITFFKVKKTLKDILMFCGEILHKRTNPNPEDASEEGDLLAENDAPTDTNINAPLNEPSPPEQQNPSQPVNLNMTDFKTRDQAYEMIRNASDYLEKIEPHSPVPFMIKKAVSLRNKNFVELMKELKGAGGGLESLWNPGDSNGDT
jgi:type VI secretion system protein ImpA